MTRVLTWAQFLADLKTELNTQDDSEDGLLLSLANEALTQMAQSGKDLREFGLDETLNINAVPLLVSTLAIANIERVYYHKYTAGVFTLRWDLTEQSGIVGPAPVSGGTNCYTIKTEANGADNPRYTFTFYPLNSAVINDKIQIVGTGFSLIVDGTTLMPYFSLYPWIKLTVIERFKVHRNESAEKVKTVTDMVNRSGSMAAVGTADKGSPANN